MNVLNKKEIGQRIKVIRQERGMTQAEFGKLMAATKGNVSLWEAGTVLPNNERLKFISELGSLTVNELLYGHEVHEETYSPNGPSIQRNFQFSKDDIMFIPYQIKIFVGNESSTPDVSEGSFLIAVKISAEGDTHEFILNCSYRPSYGKKQNLFVITEKVFPLGANRDDALSNYDQYATYLSPGFTEHIQKAIKEVIEGYFYDIRGVKKTIEVWHAL